MKTINYEGRRNVSGERVRLARAERRLSQEELAIKVQTEGVILVQDNISKIERGARMVQDYELWALSKALGVSVEWLLADCEEKNYAIGL